MNTMFLDFHSNTYHPPTTLPTHPQLRVLSVIKDISTASLLKMSESPAEYERYVSWARCQVAMTDKIVATTSLTPSSSAWAVRAKRRKTSPSTPRSSPSHLRSSAQLSAVTGRKLAKDVFRYKKQQWPTSSSIFNACTQIAWST